MWLSAESMNKIWIHLALGVHRSFFTRAMGGQIQKLFRRLKRFVIKFLAHSLVKVHMILHKKVSSWRIAKWKCLFDNTEAWRCNNRIRRTSEVEVKKKLNCYSCTHDLEHKVTGIHLRMSQRKQCFTKNVNSAFKMSQNHKKIRAKQVLLNFKKLKITICKTFFALLKTL